jgi:cytochrome c peroxidase
LESKNLTLVFGTFLILLLACTKDQMLSSSELDQQLKSAIESVSADNSLDYFTLPQEDDLSSIPQDPLNPLTEEKVDLGKLLFFETGLATDAIKEAGLGTYSCSTCHIAEAGFRPGKAQGIADGGEGFGIAGEKRVRNTDYEEDELDVQSARPLSMLNVAFSTNTMWNGQFGATGVNIGTEDVWDDIPDTETNFLGYEGIEAQNIEGMHTHRMLVTKDLTDEYGYTPMFDAAFPEVSEEDRYNNVTASLAISAFIRTLFPNKAPFQEWLKGNENAMTVSEKKGALLFFGKAKCTACHNGQGLNALEFHAIGVNDMYQIASFNATANDRRNKGRGGFTGNPDDNYKFKVPQLYNMKDTPFYFHGASKRSIREVVEYFNNAIPENPNIPEEQISPRFVSLGLDDTEIDHLVSFLEYGLRDPDLQRYKPDSILSGLCFPNNDPISSIDLGCQ